MKYGAINIDPETMRGTPVFTGTRVPVQSYLIILKPAKHWMNSWKISLL